MKACSVPYDNYLSCEVMNKKIALCYKVFEAVIWHLVIFEPHTQSQLASQGGRSS